MSRETATIITLIVFLIVFFGSLIGYFVITGTGKEPKETTFSDVTNYFGFGEATQNTQVAEKEEEIETTDLTNTPETKIVSDTLKATSSPEIKKEIIPILRQISPSPVAGAISFKKDTSIAIRYIEKTTGHISETTTETLNKQKISNSTIPKISEALWVDENSLIIRSLDDTEENIQSFYAKLVEKKNSQEKELAVSFLQENIREIDILNGRIFYIVGDDGSQGIISKPNGENKEQIWSSPLKHWSVEWPKEEIIAITNKPSNDIEGFLFFLNKKTKSFDKILSKIKGLTTLTSPDTSNVLYSSHSNNFSFYSFNVNKKELKELPIRTFPEKCVWSKDNVSAYCGVPEFLPRVSYPDSWYQGELSFSDEIMKVDTTTNTAKIIVSPKVSLNTDIDLVKPFLSSNEEYLFFINKKDSTLWSLKLR